MLSSCSAGLLQQSERSETGALVAGKDEMIENYTIQACGDPGKPTRREAVGAAWAWISAGMRVAKHQSRASAANHVCDDRPDRQRDLSVVAFVTREMDAVQLPVDMGNEQALSSRIGLRQATDEEVAGCSEAAELERPFGTLIAHLSQLCGVGAVFDSNRVRCRPDFIHNGGCDQTCTDGSSG